MTQDPFGDIPLFRELHRLLASSEGPINYEIARQVALAVAAQGGTGAPADEAAGRIFVEAVRSSERLVAGYTGLTYDEPMRAEATDVARWVSATLRGWRWLFERLAERFAGELARVSEEHGEGASDNPLQAAIGQVGPLLMGVQVGTLVGNLARNALARYDLPVPRDDERNLFVVTPNCSRTASEYGLEGDALLRWLALHEVARHLVVGAVPWVHRYLESLVSEVVDAIEIDLSGLEQRFMELSSGGIEGLQGAGPQGMLPVVPTERHRRALARLSAFLALFEGYATAATRAVGPEITGDAARIEEGMARRRVAANEGEAVLATLLGVSVDRALESAGTTFCTAVVKLKGPHALNKVWDAPDNLPTSEEIKDPFAWMERQGL
jgi:putative hydrolase